MDDDKKLSGEFVLKPEAKEKTTETSSKDKTSTKETAPVTAMSSHDPSNHLHIPEAERKMGFHKKPHFYSSTAFYPEGFTFENQDADEVVILVVRRDFITNLPWIIATLVLALLPLIIVPFLPVIAPFVVIPQITLTLYIAFFYLAVFGYIIINFTLWYFQVGIVTNKRVIDVDLHGILSRDVASAQISDIEDIRYTQVGVIPSIFNYGNVYIETAANIRSIEYDRVPEPQLIVDILQELVDSTPSS